MDRLKEIKERWSDDDIFGQVAKRDIQYLINTVEQLWVEKQDLTVAVRGLKKANEHLREIING
jgi:hypothetical protein